MSIYYFSKKRFQTISHTLFYKFFQFLNLILDSDPDLDLGLDS